MEEERQWQAQSKPKRKKTKTKPQAHQSKNFELHDYFFKHIVEENYTISSEGVNEVNEKLFYMTVYAESRMKSRGQRSRKPFGTS